MASSKTTAARREEGPRRFPGAPVAADVLLSIVSGLAAFVIAGVTEWVAIRLLGADPTELDWVSDLVLSVAFASAVFLRFRLKATQAERSRLERAQLVLDTQLRIAAEIQRRLIPPPPPSSAGCRWAARLQPAGQVGGDFYDFIRVGPDSLVAVVADISGKGVPAALLMAATQATLRDIARELKTRGTYDAFTTHALAFEEVNELMK